MTRYGEVVRQLPPGTLVPEQELEKARQRAALRQKTRGAPAFERSPSVARSPSHRLVALYACRAHETTPESPQPPDSPDARYHGLLTYSMVEILTRSASSKAPLTYRELAQRLQVRYAARPQGAPTPLVEGKGQDRVVLGTEQPARPRLLLSRDKGGYRVDAGDLYGLTTGSVLAVYSPAGTAEEPALLGHVRVGAVRPFEATVEPCEYESSPLVQDLPPLSACQPVSIDYGLRRFKLAVEVAEDRKAARQQLMKAVEPLVGGEKGGLVDLVEDPRQAEWLVRLDQDRVELVESSGNRAPFSLPGPNSPDLGNALKQNLGRVFRARNLIALANRFEGERYRGNPAVHVEVQVLRHRNAEAPGEVSARPAGGWVFRPGDHISFRIHNKSPSLHVDVTLLIVGADFRIHPFYPKAGELVKSLKPGESCDTPPPPGMISNEPPFGPECLVAIAVPPTNPPVDFTVLSQDGLTQKLREGLQLPLGELLVFALYRSGSRGTLPRSVAEQVGMRALTWRTEPK
jgi:hypothetical protein